MGRLPRAWRIALVSALVAVAVGCGGPSKLDAVPEELLGAWEGKGRFERNSLEITADSFTLGAGELQLGVYQIESIDTSPGRDQTQIYRLHHRADEGYADTLVLTYQAEPFPLVRVGASPEPWMRSSATR